LNEFDPENELFCEDPNAKGEAAGGFEAPNWNEDDAMAGLLASGGGADIILLEKIGAVADPKLKSGGSVEAESEKLGACGAGAAGVELWPNWKLDTEDDAAGVAAGGCDEPNEKTGAGVDVGPDAAAVELGRVGLEIGLAGAPKLKREVEAALLGWELNENNGFSAETFGSSDLTGAFSTRAVVDEAEVGKANIEEAAGG
jgi:hypothetical protein